jgi:carbohydrate-selective porin OprB
MAAPTMGVAEGMPRLSTPFHKFGRVFLRPNVGMIENPPGMRSADTLVLSLQLMQSER